jgi:uncharacterized protein
MNMSMDVYTLSTGTFVPMLHALAQILDKAIAQADAKGIALAALPDARLAPDMYPLSKQVQIACDLATQASARLSGVEPPRAADAPRTVEDLKARILATIAFVQGLQSAAFAGAEGRTIRFPLIDNLAFEANGFAYLRDWALPNFYFHIVTAYDILRQQGFAIGKRDYLSHAGTHIRATG